MCGGRDSCVGLGAVMGPVEETPGEGWDLGFDTPTRQALNLPASPLELGKSHKIDPGTTTPRGKRGVCDRAGGGGEASGSGSGSPDENVNARSNPASPRGRGVGVVPSSPEHSSPDDDSLPTSPVPKKGPVAVVPAAFEQRRRDALAAKQRRLDGMMGRISPRADFGGANFGGEDEEVANVVPFVQTNVGLDASGTENTETTETKLAHPTLSDDSDSDVEEGWDDLFAETTPCARRLGIGEIQTMPSTSGASIPWHKLEPQSTPTLEPFKPLPAPPSASPVTKTVSTETKTRSTEMRSVTQKTNPPPETPAEGTYEPLTTSTRAAPALSHGASLFIAALTAARRGSDSDRDALRKRLLRVGDSGLAKNNTNTHGERTLTEGWLSDSAAAAFRDAGQSRDTGVVPGPVSPTTAADRVDESGEAEDTFNSYKSPTGAASLGNTPRKLSGSFSATPRKPPVSPGVTTKGALGTPGHVSVHSTPSRLAHSTPSPVSMGKSAAARVLLAAAAPARGKKEKTHGATEPVTNVMFTPPPSERNKPLFALQSPASPFSAHQSPVSQGAANTPDARKRSAARRIMLAAAVRKASEYQSLGEARDVNSSPRDVQGSPRETSGARALAGASAPFDAPESPIRKGGSVVKRGLGYDLDATNYTGSSSMEPAAMEVVPNETSSTNQMEPTLPLSEEKNIEKSDEPEAFALPKPKPEEPLPDAVPELDYETDTGYGTAMESQGLGFLNEGDDAFDSRLKDDDTARNTSAKQIGDTNGKLNSRAYRNLVAKCEMLTIQLEENEWSREALVARVTEAERAAESAAARTKNTQLNELAQLKEEVDRNGYLRRLLGKADQRRQEARGREKEVSVRLGVLQNSHNARGEEFSAKLQRLEEESRGARRRVLAERTRGHALDRVLANANVELAEQHRLRRRGSTLLGMAFCAIVVLLLRVLAGGRGGVGGGGKNEKRISADAYRSTSSANMAARTDPHRGAGFGPSV